MSKKRPDSEKELLVQFIENLKSLIPLGQRKLLADSVEQIITTFDLEIPPESFTSDRRFLASTAMGRKAGRYFMRNQVTGKYYIGSVKELAGVLNCTEASIYINLRRASQKGSDYCFKVFNGHDYRINLIIDDDELKSDIMMAEQIREDYEKKLALKKQCPYANEDGSY